MRSKWWTLAVVSLGIFMLLLDITVVNVALPSIARELHASFEELQWVVDAYALTLAAGLLAAGSFADRHGRRLVFTSGLVLFTTASALCGFAQSPLMLDGSRAVQGIGGAMMFATALALVGNAFRGKERGIAFGTFGAVTGIAVAVGPLIGGGVTDGLGWRWVFFLNLPLGVIALVATALRVGESRDRHAGATDWFGLVTFSGALFGLVFALVQGNERGWTSAEILGALGGAAFLLGAFIARSRRAPHPLLDLELFRVPTFVGISAVAFALSAAVFGLMLYLTLYLQTVLGYSPLQAGLRFLPSTVAMFVIAPIAGRLSVHLPVRLLLSGGLLFCAAGVGALTAVSPSSGWTVLIPGFVLQGIGVGMINPPLAASAIGVVEPHKGGMASGINSTFRQLGIATGVAGFGAIFQHQLVATTFAHLRDRHLLATLQAEFGPRFSHMLITGEAAAVAGHLPVAQRGALSQAYRYGFTHGLDLIFWIGAAVALLGALVAMVSVRRQDFVASAGHGEPVAALA